MLNVIGCAELPIDPLGFFMDSVRKLSYGCLDRRKARTAAVRIYRALVERDLGFIIKVGI